MSGTSRRLLGLDFGDKTVGVAVSDPLGMTAQGVEIIQREKPTKLRQTLARIAILCEEYTIGAIVLGLPLLEDGREGERCAKTRDFAEQVKRRTGLPVHLLDERFTTAEADDIMDRTGIRREDRKAYVDEIAAMIILQEWLDTHGTV